MRRITGSLGGRKRFEALVLAALFGFCSLSGLVWGLVVRTPPPPDRTIESLSVFPAARDVATPTEKPPGLAGPTATAIINSTAEGLLNYDFRTTDSPDEVIAFYKELMQRRYGFKVWWVEERLEEAGKRVWVLNFLREGTYRIVRNVAGWDKESVKVTINQEDAGYLYVQVRHDVREFAP